MATPTALLEPADRPVYVRLKDAIRAGIAAGEWKIGEAIPSERELCAAYGISRMTARQAIGDLVHEGVLTRQQGRGTFVAQPRFAQRLRYLTGFTQDMAARGIRASSRVLELRRTAAPADVAAELAVAPGSDLVFIERIRLADGQPVGLERAWLSVREPDALLGSAAAGSVYEALAALGHHPVRAEQRIVAGLADERETGLLALAPGAPVLRTHRRSYDVAGRAIELAEAAYRGDAYTFISELVAPPD
ncbi:MAG TPA: GntR family transcriptional regulator [Candidatus Limnocylindria bacterium]|nr:GntR family transcriptional regulator [Candidatus Limnocylindria bacterium]